MSADNKNVKQFRLFYFIGEWIASAWRKIITFIDNLILEETDIYINYCWNCKDPIRSTKTRNKLKNWLESKWIGNKKCTKGSCNYFLCNNCNKCLCDGSYYRLKKEPVLTKWVEV